ncbi:uncharacterized protein L3040_001847 [Drepanopeziza brunnea f. sp. 'multigermtubi']|uniref:uncharacterized protein n=1 Tax=Drepanopeziza brunnea f. sp. 'multigermtubi' TaxID=698441 RepID=UPI002399C01C|nr:hypothetical protein L3040_001847 [Drepanopeziza brunnea f. sp. 'multigermtubi']
MEKLIRTRAKPAKSQCNSSRVTGYPTITIPLRRRENLGSPTRSQFCPSLVPSFTRSPSIFYFDLLP